MHTYSWSLVIKSVQESDAGKYICQVRQIFANLTRGAGHQVCSGVRCWQVHLSGKANLCIPTRGAGDQVCTGVRCWEVHLSGKENPCIPNYISLHN
jgi:hypothetical protein